MDLENTYEDLTFQLADDEAVNLAQKIPEKYDNLEDDRLEQQNDIKLIRDSIYRNQIPSINGWDSNIELPDIYELAQTLKSHISENLFITPDAMFDVTGSTPQAQAFANRQKAMLVNTFNQMKIEDELEKVIDGIVETGECTLFVGWETKVKTIRRAQTIEEQLIAPTKDGFVVEEKVVYDNPRIKHIKPDDFVFDKHCCDSWDNCPKIYRNYLTIDDLTSNQANNLLTDDKIQLLKGVVDNKFKKETDKSTEDNRVEVLEYWGDIELSTGEILKNWLIVVAGRRTIIRCEANPYIVNPFIHANIIECPQTQRGISPLRVALILNNISSTILNKQIDALALMMNPPYLAPKGCFNGNQVVKPGAIIEYDSALMPNSPISLSFDKALQGWDFLTYFKSTIESATGIFNNMAGNLQNEAKTATEVNYSLDGQSARLNMILDAVSRKVIIPMVETTAELISNFKMGSELINFNDRGKTLFIEINDDIRNENYVYRYGDRKSTLERRNNMSQIINIIKSFAQIPTVSNQIDWVECFKFALEQYGVENANNFLVDLNMSLLQKCVNTQ